MAPFASDHTVVRAPVLWRKVGDEIIIRRRGVDELVALNAGGAALWEAIADPVTVGELVARLADGHDASRHRVEADVQAALAQMQRHGVLA